MGWMSCFRVLLRARIVCWADEWEKIGLFGIVKRSFMIEWQFRIQNFPPIHVQYLSYMDDMTKCWIYQMEANDEEIDDDDNGERRR